MTGYQFTLAALYGLACGAVSVGIGAAAGRQAQLGFIPVATVSGVLLGPLACKMTKEK